MGIIQHWEVCQYEGRQDFPMGKNVSRHKLTVTHLCNAALKQQRQFLKVAGKVFPGKALRRPPLKYHLQFWLTRISGELKLKWAQRRALGSIKKRESLSDEVD